MKQSITTFLGISILVALGCASTRPQLTLAHDIDVPTEYRSGNFSEAHPGYMSGNSAIERYVNAYERGWLIAVQRYAKDIDYEDASPFHMNGWIEEVVGGQTGYADAKYRIIQLIQHFGKARVSELLNKWALPEEK